MYLLNLHTTPKGHLIKIGTFLQKNMRSHDVLNGLNSIKFLEILNSNKTPNIFSTYQLKLKRAQAIFNVFQNTHTPRFETF